MRGRWRRISRARPGRRRRGREEGARPKAQGARAVKRFAELYASIDSTTATNAKTAALVRYFAQAAPRDAAWAAWFLTGHRPRQAVKTRNLHTWAAETAGLPLWLFEESYDAVGDLAETIALV